MTDIPTPPTPRPTRPGIAGLASAISTWLEPEDNASGVIYGTIAVGAVLAAESTRRETFADTMEATLIILGLYWLAHTYATVVGDRLRNRETLSAGRLWRAFLHEGAIVKGAPSPSPCWACCGRGRLASDRRHRRPVEQCPRSRRLRDHRHGAQWGVGSPEVYADRGGCAPRRRHPARPRRPALTSRRRTPRHRARQVTRPAATMPSGCTRRTDAARAGRSRLHASPDRTAIDAPTTTGAGSCRGHRPACADAEDDDEKRHTEGAANLTSGLVDRTPHGKSLRVQARDRSPLSTGKVSPIPSPVISVAGSQCARYAGWSPSGWHTRRGHRRSRPSPRGARGGTPHEPPVTGGPRTEPRPRAGPA